MSHFHLNSTLRQFNSALSFRIPIWPILVLLFLFAVSSSHSYADEPIPDAFKIALGGYILGRFDSRVSVTEPTLGAGVSVNPADTLGLSTKQTVLRLDGYYRFNSAHAMSFSWYKISSTGDKRIEDEIKWQDEDGNSITIPVGARVASTLDYDIYKVAYLWSFYHNDKVELAAGGGLHITRLAISLEAETTSSGIGARSVKTTIPLPVLSFGLTYTVTPRFHWFVTTEAFAMAFEDWKGSYIDTNVGAEYRVLRNVGIGLALGSNGLSISEETSDYKLTYDNRISGAHVYLAAYF